MVTIHNIMTYLGWRLFVALEAPWYFVSVYFFQVVRAMPASYAALCRARAFIRDHYQEPLSLSDMAARANLSPYHFLRSYRRLFRETPHAYRNRLRVERAKVLLASTQASVTAICFEVGFSSLGSFSTWFRRHTGLNPSQYRRRARPSDPVAATHTSMFIPQCYVTVLTGAVV